MKKVSLIIGILFLLSGVSLIAGTAEEVPSKGLKFFQEVINNKEIEKVQYEGFYRASLKNNSVKIKEIINIFKEIDFTVVNITEENRIIKLEGLFSSTKGALIISSEKDKMFISLNVYDLDLNKILYTVEIVSDAFSQITSEEIYTWTFKGSLNNRMNEEDMLMLAGKIINRMDGKIYEEIVHYNSLNVLGYSPHLLPGTVINGKTINMNLAFKADVEDEITYFYAGVPFISIPY